MYIVQTSTEQFSKVLLVHECLTESLWMNIYEVKTTKIVYGHQTELKVLSLNVNGLGNPVKRAKIMTKLKKEKTHKFPTRNSSIESRT